jgi:hypothetical protein
LIILTTLIELTNTAEVTLWLLHRPPRSDAFVRSLGRRGAAPAALHEVPPPQAAQPDQLHVAEPLPTVPPNDFVTFRSACLERLPDDDAAARVDAHFQAALERGFRVLRDAAAAPDTVADLVHVLVNAAPADPELIVGLRAIQVAAWHHDLFVQIDLPRVLNSEERPRMTSVEMDRVVIAYRQPYRPITIALTRAGTVSLTSPPSPSPTPPPTGRTSASVAGANDSETPPHEPSGHSSTCGTVLERLQTTRSFRICLRPSPRSSRTLPSISASTFMAAAPSAPATAPAPACEPSESR